MIRNAIESGGRDLSVDDIGIGVNDLEIGFGQGLRFENGQKIRFFKNREIETFNSIISRLGPID